MTFAVKHPRPFSLAGSRVLGPKSSMGLKSVSKSTTELKGTHMSEISKGSFGLIMGWPYDGVVWQNGSNFYVFAQYEKEKLFSHTPPS